MKHLLIIVSLLAMFSCLELQKLAGSALAEPKILTDIQIGNGLKEALQNGVSKQVTKLTSTDGFYSNEAVKIPLPNKLNTVAQKMNALGLGGMTDRGVRLLNHAAEDAVKEATPIFVHAISSMSFLDAKAILMGDDGAATAYLRSTTRDSLYSKFYPQVEQSLKKVGADEAWSAVTKKYNAISFVTKVNPDLKDYVTNKALEGVFKMIAIEEKEIRGNLSARTSNLLKQVFSLQDQK